MNKSILKYAVAGLLIGSGVPTSAAATDWSGFYAGIQGGYQSTDTVFNGLTSLVDPDNGDSGGGEQCPETTECAQVNGGATALEAFNDDFNFKGFIGGGHVGYNFGKGSFVFGVEADFEMGDGEGNGVSGNQTINEIPETGTNIPGELPDIILSATVKQDFQSSLRARLGWATERTLVYATAGLAVTQFDYTLQAEKAFTGEVAPPDSFSNTAVGYTLGAGIEFLVADNVSLGAEYRYTDYGTIKKRVFEQDGSPLTNDVDFDLDSHAIRARLTFHFGGY